MFNPIRTNQSRALGVQNIKENNEVALQAGFFFFGCLQIKRFSKCYRPSKDTVLEATCSALNENITLQDQV